MDAAIDNRTCTNDACDFSSSGKCVEGNDPNECPHLLKQSEGTSQVATATRDSTERESISTSLHIGDGMHLSMEDGSSLLKSNYAPIVAFIGPVAAGKTSLIAEVYDAFQYGGYESLRFAGSQSLVAFEQICHMARSSSKALIPVQERTDLREDPMFFHLLIANGKGERCNILLADRSGETYEQINDRPKVVQECFELNRADVLNILVDGERLCEPTKRANVLTQCAHCIQTIALSGALSQCGQINLILTKLDFVDAHENKDRVHADFDALPARIKEQCGDKIIDLRSHKIAACPHNDLHPKGFGVETLLVSWLCASPMEGGYTYTLDDPTRSMDRTSSTMRL